jgi:ribonuclease HI
MTANVAEYIAVLRGLEALKEVGYVGQQVQVRSDSKLVMSQLGMLCVVRSPRLYPWWRKVKAAAKDFEVEWEWAPRAWNREADRQIRQVIFRVH